MKILKNIALFALVIAISVGTSQYVADLYKNITHQGGGFFMDFSQPVGFLLSYIYFTALMYTAFGGSEKLIWSIALSLPVVSLFIYIDFREVFVPLILFGFGWISGYGVSLLVRHIRVRNVSY